MFAVYYKARITAAAAEANIENESEGEQEDETNLVRFSTYVLNKFPFSRPGSGTF